MTVVSVNRQDVLSISHIVPNILCLIKLFSQLVKIGELNSRTGPNFTSKWFEFSQENAKKGGFTNSVWPYNSYTVPL